MNGRLGNEAVRGGGAENTGDAGSGAQEEEVLEEGGKGMDQPEWRDGTRCPRRGSKSPTQGNPAGRLTGNARDCAISDETLFCGGVR